MVGRQEYFRAGSRLTPGSSLPSHTSGLTCRNTTPMRLDASVIGELGRGGLWKRAPVLKGSGGLYSLCASRARIGQDEHRSVKLIVSAEGLESPDVRIILSSGAQSHIQFPDGPGGAG